MKLTYEVDETELWSNVFGSAWEQYPWWTEVEYQRGAAWDIPGKVLVSWDCEGIAGYKMLTVGDLAQACEAMHLGPGELEDIDSDLGDQIVQYATMGDVVFG